MRKRKTHEPRTLKHDEKVLWNLVTRTVSPMKSRIAKPSDEADFEDNMATLFPAPKPAPAARKPVAAMHPKDIGSRAPVKKQAPTPGPIAAHIDRPVYRKIAKGRLPIDSQIDLHDMTQDQAVMRLQSFLDQARNRGHRHVLVITGKGGSPTSEGVLRRMLPMWLNTQPFSSIVNGYQAASREHGGDGAFYVRLRRLR